MRLWWVTCVWLLCVDAVPVLTGPEEIEETVLARRFQLKSNALASFMLWPGNFLPTIHHLGLESHMSQKSSSEMDLELFDFSAKESEQIRDIHELFAPVTKDHAKYFNIATFRKLRPLLSLLPPLRVINDAKLQFQQYAGEQGVLDSKQLQKRMKKMGLDVSEGQSGAMVARMKTASGQDHFFAKHNLVDRCDFVTSVLRERGVLTKEQIMKADKKFLDELVPKAIEAARYDKEFEIVPFDLWLDTEQAKHIFAFPDEQPVYTDEMTRAKVTEGIAVLYDLVDDSTESNPDRMMSRCEHRILDAYSDIDLERDERDIEYEPPQYDVNRVASWLNENFGNVTHLTRTCKGQTGGKPQCAGVLQTRKTAGCDKFQSSELGGVGCALSEALAASARPVTMTDLHGTTTQFSPLRAGVDSLFYIHDDNDDRMLSEAEFRNLVQSLSTFGELSYKSTKDNPEDRTTSGKPYFHLWYLDKGRRYYLNLMKNIASMNSNRLQTQAFKDFWKALHFPEVDRHWQRFTSTPGGPVNSLDLQGLYNRLGATTRISQDLIREWSRPEKGCNLEALTAYDRNSVADILSLDPGSNKAADFDAIDQLQNDLCQKVYGDTRLTCKCDDCPKDYEREEITHYSTTQYIYQYTCRQSDEDEKSSAKQLEQEIPQLTALEYLDSVLLGIPAFANNVDSSEYKHLLRMLHGSTDNFDEVSPERWQILSPILRTFSLLDTNKNGKLSKDEFEAFGRCTSRVLPRFRIPSNARQEDLFNKVLATSMVISEFDSLYAEERIADSQGESSADSKQKDEKEMALSEYSLLFSDLPSEQCIRKYCTSPKVKLKMLPICRTYEPGMLGLCVMNQKNGKNPALDTDSTGHPEEYISPDNIDRDCDPFLTEVEEKKASLEEYQAQVRQDSKSRGYDRLRCKAEGILSFDSFFDPGFASEVRGLLSPGRAERCATEAKCRDANSSDPSKEDCDL